MARVRTNECVPINKCYQSDSVIRLYEAAADVVVPGRYRFLNDNFYTLLEYADRNDCACDMCTTRDIISIAFKIGFLKGGRAAMKGEFKEPPKRKESGKEIKLTAHDFY